MGICKFRRGFYKSPCEFPIRIHVGISHPLPGLAAMAVKLQAAELASVHAWNLAANAMKVSFQPMDFVFFTCPFFFFFLQNWCFCFMLFFWVNSFALKWQRLLPGQERVVTLVPGRRAWISVAKYQVFFLLEMFGFPLEFHDVVN